MGTPLDGAPDRSALQELEAALPPHLSAVEREVADFALQAIAIPTPNPPGANYEAMAEFLGQRLADVGLAVRTMETPPTLLVRHRISPKARRLSPLALGSHGLGRSLARLG